MNRQSLGLSKKVWFLSLLIIVISLQPTVFGQAGTATIRGKIVDQQGNVVAGANVTLLNTAEGRTRTAITTDSGLFSFESIPAGDYTLSAEATGFKKGQVTEIHALVSKVTPIDVQLEAGNISETVTISTSAAEALINRDDGSLGNNFVSEQVTQLPLSGRSIVPLLSLQAGVTRDGYVAGARSDQSNITLDGVDINEQQTNAVGTTQDNPTTSQLPTNNTVIRLNSEAIEEFRVTTTNANANQGRSSGGQISLVTKSGSNDWHGAAFEFYRSKGLAENDFFNIRSAVEKPQLIRHDFSGAIGGPIIKDKLFFFYTYEGRRQLSQTPQVSIVPLASMGLGQLRYENPAHGITTLTTAQLNSIFPAVGMNPAAIAAFAAAAAKYPANDFSVGDSIPGELLNTAGFRFNAATPVKLNSHEARFDLNLTDKQQLFLRGNVIYDLTNQAPAFPDSLRPVVWSHPWALVVGHTWAMNPNLVNNFHYGYTREGFTAQGDSAVNSISFRFIYSPSNFTRTLSRATPVQNITDDVTWAHGNHNLQFGANVRIVRNERATFENAFDDAITNPSFYNQGAGASLSTPVDNFSPIGGSRSAVQNAVSALIGRFSQYTANFTFDSDGKLLAQGVPSVRNFATEEYEGYVQDIWKIKPNLTLTFGLRYSLSRPVYEKNGFEVKSNIPLTDYFNMRLAGAAAGVPFNQPLTFSKSGPANNAAPLYDWDKNNFQPRASIAWTPKFQEGFLARLLGKHEQSVFRGGFGITNDAYGEQLAVSFDLNNAVGFVSNFTTSANTFCTNDPSCAAPLFTGFGQPVRGLPGVVLPANLTFPSQEPSDNSRRIQSTLDSKLVAPTNYTWNFTYERQLPHGLVVSASYIGRYATHLIATRDVMALNNLVDPKSGMDWYTAAGMLEDIRRTGKPSSSIAQIPYFQNLFPANLAQLINDNYFQEAVLDPSYNATQAVYAMGFEVFGNDWTDTQDALDTATGKNLFFNPQYGALSTISSIGHSWYNGATISVRERLGRQLTMDFNYTWSHSMDDSSGLQSSTSTGGYGTNFILNPIRQHDSYADSDFDIRHIVNVNAIWQLPFGQGRKFFSDSKGLGNALVGGWQISGIMRWNSGLPFGAPVDDARWATNWNVQSSAVRIKEIQTCPTRGGKDVAPKLFGCDPAAAYASFRNAKPGETGDRSPFRLPGYFTIDMGVGKEFTIPGTERQKIQLRFEIFNLTNTQSMGAVDTSRTGYGIQLDPFNGDAPPKNWSNFTGIQGAPREVQFGIRYSF